MSAITVMTNAVKFFFTDQKKFKKKINDKIQIYRKRKIIPQEKRTVSQSIDDAFERIVEGNFKKVLVCADQSFFQKTVNHFPKLPIEWCSINGEDRLRGSASIENLDLKYFDFILVGGKDVNTFYVHILKTLKTQNLLLPTFWVANDFEFGGSTIPVPSEVENAEFYLFQHYGDFFQSKDPLLVKISIRDQKNISEKYKILGPGETLKVSLKESFPNRSGPCVVEFSTTHPVLTRKRHRRWRVWADLYWKNSFISLHGAHDYGPSDHVSTIAPPNVVGNGKVIVTIPNYYLDLTPMESEAIQLQDQKTTVLQRDLTKPLEEVLFKSPTNKANIGISYQGYGGSFWYYFNQLGFMGNHHASQSLELKDARLDDSATNEWVHKIRSKGYMIYPHALPVVPASENFEFGFSFEWANPPVESIVCHVFDGEGKKIEEFNYSKKTPGHLYTSELLKNSKSRDIANLVILETDFSDKKIDPKKIAMWGDLAFRNKQTLDSDLTEYQSCWRNVGTMFSQFPHWLHPSKNILCRTNVVGRALNNSEMKTEVIIANGSGNLNYKTKANFLFKLYNHSGKSIEKEYSIAAFTYQAISLNDAFPNVNEFLSLGFGGIVVSSSDADLNIQIVTKSNKGAVSLQHLWGY